MTSPTLPHWDLSNVFPALESEELSAGFSQLKSLLSEMEEHEQKTLLPALGSNDSTKLAEALNGAIERVNQALELATTLDAYIYSFISTDSYNTTARRLLSELEQITVRLRKQLVRLKAGVGQVAQQLPAVLEHPGAAHEHAFYLHELAEQSKYLMSPVEEDLAADLHLSGASAWSRLQNTVVSQIKTEFELDGKVQTIPVTALLNMTTHSDGDVRKRAFETELVIWKQNQEPLAAALNGIKGEVITLNKRRKREDALHSALEETRMDRETLDAMLSAMRASFPIFRGYFKAKARRLGKPALPWYDRFAPMGRSERKFSFDEARGFILDNFNSFSPELSNFASRAFKNCWIDAEPRSGKSAGAFCMPIPAVKESRILCNFDGSLDEVFTIAHELGHGFHNECAFRAGKTNLQQNTPMTLAETASIMCETITLNAALKNISDAQEELAVLESALINYSQLIIDIYSRFLFESELFERREKAELSPDDLCDIMGRAQQATYGDGLDPNTLHPYMWTWKPHYYSASPSFYNFPYAFGLLFGVGLYAVYQQRGPEFVPDYMNLLASTGDTAPAELAGRFGINLRTEDFWANSLKVIAQKAERYEQI